MHDVAIIGGGFFAIRLALLLAKQGKKVLVLESEKDICLRSSHNNQARVHNGYHYLRSFQTAYSSHRHFSRFKEDFAECIYQDFDKIYAIAKNSFTNAMQFRDFCRRLDLPYSELPVKYRKFFNYDLIEDAFITEEVSFDIDKMRRKLRSQVEDNDEFIDIKLNTKISRVNIEDDFVNVESYDDNFRAKKVFNIAYAGINHLLKKSGFNDSDLLDLKLELTEMCLVKPSRELQEIAVTVMDGPFFSLMPFPSRDGLYTLSHVRYTPHKFWFEKEQCFDPYKYLSKDKRESKFMFMLKDSQRFMPVLEGLEYKSSLFEMKTVVTRNEIDDGRPIVYKEHCDNFISVLGTKLDNIYDLEEKVLTEEL